MTRSLTGIVLAFALVAMGAACVGADRSRQAGADLAEQHCARCHAVASGPSPVAAAPAFSGLARKWPIEYLAEALAEGIVTSHRHDVEMPEFVFTPDEIDDLLAYLESVQE